jgi:hypothetical protein
MEVILYTRKRFSCLFRRRLYVFQESLLFLFFKLSRCSFQSIFTSSRQTTLNFTVISSPSFVVITSGPALFLHSSLSSSVLSLSTSFMKSFKKNLTNALRDSAQVANSECRSKSPRAPTCISYINSVVLRVFLVLSYAAFQIA